MLLYSHIAEDSFLQAWQYYHSHRNGNNVIIPLMRWFRLILFRQMNTLFKPSTSSHPAMPKGSSSPQSQTTPYASLGLAGLLLVSALMTGLPDEMQQSLKLYTDHRFSSHPWGAITGHLLHYSWPHFLLNATGLMLWASIYGRQKHLLYWISITVFIMLVVDVGLFAQANFSWYVGFSGVLHGLLVHGALLGEGIKNPLNRVLLIALFIKIGTESVGLLPDLSRTVTSIDTAYETHLYGLTGGLLSSLVLYLWHQAGKPPPPPVP